MWNWIWALFETPIPYQDPNVIDSRGIIENITPGNSGNQETDDDQILGIDPVVNRRTFQELGHNTVKKQNFGVTSDSHLKNNQILADPSESTITEDINDMRSASDMNVLQHENNTRGGKYNSWPNPSPNYPDI